MQKKSLHIHRHFLVIPLALMLCITPVIQGAFQSSVTETSFIKSSVKQAKGLQYRVLDGAKTEDREEGLTLKSGSILVASEGLGMLRASTTLQIALFHGAAHVSRYGDSVSVAALTSPVLVQEGDRHMIIPVGRQWRSGASSIPSLDAGIAVWLSGRTTTLIPEKFLYQQLQNLDSFSLYDDSLPEARMHKPVVVLPESLHLSAAKRRSQELVVAMARAAVEQEDPEMLQSVLDTAPPLSSESVRQLSVLLARCIGDARLSIPLMSVVGAQSHAWLLMSMHSDFSSLAWAYDSPPLNTAEKMTAMFFLPVLDILPHAFGPLAVERWARLVEKTAMGTKDPSALLNPLLVHTRDALVYMEQQMYPERTRWYIQHILRITSPYADYLSINAQKSLYALSHWEDISLLAPRASQKKQQALAKKISKPLTVTAQILNQLPPHEVETRAHALLKDHYALFTVETEVSAIAPNIARISNVVFTTVDTDRTFSFLLDVQQKNVSELSEEGKEYPFTLPLDRFVRWVVR